MKAGKLEKDLCKAILEFNKEKVTDLLNAGANIKDPPKGSVGHLVIAAESHPKSEVERQSKYEILQLLIDNGADVNRDNPLFHSELDFRTTKILVDAGYKINASFNDFKSNFVAVLEKSLSNPAESKPIIKLLLASGANMNSKQNHEYNGLSIKQMVENILGDEMPKLAQVGKDKDGNAIYRQEGAKTFAQLKNIAEKAFKKGASDMVADIIGNGTGVTDVLKDGHVARYLDKDDIRNVSLTAKAPNGNTLLNDAHIKATNAMKIQQSHLSGVLKSRDNGQEKQ